VIIEVAGVCQAQCPYCAYHSGKSRRKEAEKKPAVFMSVDLFRATIARLAQSEAFTKGRVDRVYLYNWGEAFLAPALDEYLEILKEHRLYAVISSNFQKRPDVKKENLPIINEVLFSVSGMSQDTYGRIHGGSLERVLANFEAFRNDLKRHSPQATIFMAWHRYTFNEHEFWDAYRYSRRHRVGFLPSVAFLADLMELLQAAGDRLPPERKANATRDLFYDHMVNAMASYKENGSNYDCPAWDDVVIDEQGQMLLCCGTDSQFPIGHALETDYDEMRERKIKHGICKACKEKGVAEWAHNNHHDHNQLPWPAGGGFDRVRLKMTYNGHKVKNDIRHALDGVPFGGAVLDVYKRIKLLALRDLHA
jgi:MoaA/NifB/PqqE/SkfB family radical SAM enzyme